MGRIGYGGAEHATAAADALPSWADTPARGRADLLHAAADLIAARSKEIGTLLAQEARQTQARGSGPINEKDAR